MWSSGLRYRVCFAALSGHPDIVFPCARLAVFVDGDYWHGGQWKKRNLTALEDQFSRTESRDYWLYKIRRNMCRDSSVTAELLADGWTVLRFWESDIRRDLEGCVRMVVDAVRNGTSPSGLAIGPSKTVAEFFAGIGLMRMGLEKKGWRVLFANDIEPQKYDMYKGHFDDYPGHFVLGDVHHLTEAQVPTVTLATASFPCNDLSLAGARRGLCGRQSSAFWGFMRVIEDMGARKPLIVLLENVTGFLTSHAGDDFRSALLELNRLNYVVDAIILDAANFVPQSRQRLFVVAVQEDNRAYEIAREPRRFFESEVRPKALADFILNNPEIRWRIRDLPSPPPCNSSLESILEDLPSDAPEWWSRQRAVYLLNQMSPRHRQTAERMISSDKVSYGTVFRRIRGGRSVAELRTDGIAGCLRTPRGGSGRQILFQAGKGSYAVRLLTPRECARLMGAADFRITVPMNQALFGFGDAVCVPVIEWIAEHYLNPLVNEMMRGRPLRVEGRMQAYGG